MDLPEPLIQRLRTVRSAMVITGAGLSAESGIRPYRGPGGVYSDPEEGDALMDALSGDTFRRDPERTWRYLIPLLVAARDAQPNPGHKAIALIEQRVARFLLVTQNVDGLHGMAGSSNVVELHGNARQTICTRCGRVSPLGDPSAIAGAPACSGCGGLLRPDVVLFDEYLPEEEVKRVTDFLRTPPDLVLVAGTTALFHYIAAPVAQCAMAGSLTVEVNPEPTVASDFAMYALRTTAGDALPELAAAIPHAPGR